MPGYRLYLMNGDGGIAKALEFECDGDAEALRHAEHRLDHRAAELWSGARVVAKLPKRENA
jgi:hypothetical protein